MILISARNVEKYDFQYCLIVQLGKNDIFRVDILRTLFFIKK
nr:MAG TPA: hypothetical protein [Caudoviricetes sp.]